MCAVIETTVLVIAVRLTLHRWTIINNFVKKPDMPSTSSADKKKQIKIAHLPQLNCIQKHMDGGPAIYFDYSKIFFVLRKIRRKLQWNRSTRILRSFILKIRKEMTYFCTLPEWYCEIFLRQPQSCNNQKQNTHTNWSFFLFYHWNFGMRFTYLLFCENMFEIAHTRTHRVKVLPAQIKRQIWF